MIDVGAASLFEFGSPHVALVASPRDFLFGVINREKSGPFKME